MKKQKVMSLVSNILLSLGAVLSVTAIYLTVSQRAGLPPGVCPIDDNRPLYIAAIAVLITSFLMSIYADRLKKRAEK